MEEEEEEEDVVVVAEARARAEVGEVAEAEAVAWRACRKMRPDSCAIRLALNEERPVRANCSGMALISSDSASSDASSTDSLADCRGAKMAIGQGMRREGHRP